MLTGSLVEEAEEFEVKYQTPYQLKDEFIYQVYNADATPLKTIMRSNPGLMILKKGVIVAKYHYNELTNYADLKKSVLK